jgi:hypothetical protein
MEQLGEMGQRVQMPYFDDVLHRALGLTGHDWQNLYHFTIGAPVEDLRVAHGTAARASGKGGLRIKGV